MGLPSSPRNGASIDWVALHSAEGARTVGSLYDFFNRGQHASSHAGADGYQLSDGWVPDERAAWTLLNGNPRSLNLEMCGFAHWTREQWLSEGWVDGVWNPRQMIRNAARYAREKCDKHGVPKRLLTAEQVGRNERGIIDHFRYTLGKKDGNHTDVGNNFPFDVFMADVNGTPAPGGNTEEPEMQLIRGNERPDTYIVSLGPDGLQKRHIPNTAELELIQELSGQAVREVQQWKIDTVSTASVVAGAVWNALLPVEDSDTPSAFRPAHRVVAGVYESVADVVADVDEEALATALAARGITSGASPAQVKDAMREVLTNTRLTPGVTTQQ